MDHSYAAAPKRPHRNLMKSKGLRGSAKHCVYGLCNSDARYPERCPPDLTWIPFVKPGVIKPGNIFIYQSRTSRPNARRVVKSFKVDTKNEN